MPNRFLTIDEASRIRPDLMSDPPRVYDHPVPQDLCHWRFAVSHDFYKGKFLKLLGPDKTWPRQSCFYVVSTEPPYEDCFGEHEFAGAIEIDLAEPGKARAMFDEKPLEGFADSLSLITREAMLFPKMEGALDWLILAERGFDVAAACFRHAEDAEAFASIYADWDLLIDPREVVDRRIGGNFVGDPPKHLRDAFLHNFPPPA